MVGSCDLWRPYDTQNEKAFDANRSDVTSLAVRDARKIIKFISEVKSNRITPKYVIKTLKSTMTDRTPES